MKNKVAVCGFGIVGSEKVLEGATFTRVADISKNQIEGIVVDNLNRLIESNSCSVNETLVKYAEEEHGVDISSCQDDSAPAKRLPDGVGTASILRATEENDPLIQELAKLVLRKQEIMTQLKAKYSERSEVQEVAEAAQNIVQDIYDKACLMESKLTKEEREKLKKSQFGIPALKEFPLEDAAHVRSAMSYFRHAPEKYKSELAKNIEKAAKKYGVRVNPKAQWYGYLK